MSPRGRRAAAAALLAAALFAATSAAFAAAARAEQTYRVTGKDTFSVGSSQARSEITYRGVESLARRKKPEGTVYEAQARYVRNDQGASTHAHATFKALVLSDGEQRDVSASDPDYLTVLNQPFAVQLDAETLRDLSRLHRDVPFDSPSPITGSTLRGRLHNAGEAIVSGARAIGVTFEARGAMKGTLPDRPSMRLEGRIHMQGEAYYRSEDALLVMLDATLTISGNLTSEHASEPVTIVYRRTIRAETAPARPSH